MGAILYNFKIFGRKIGTYTLLTEILRVGGCTLGHPQYFAPGIIYTEHSEDLLTKACRDRTSKQVRPRRMTSSQLTSINTHPKYKPRIKLSISPRSKLDLQAPAFFEFCIFSSVCNRLNHLCW
ncbi:hypothetical protein Hdeb2414_s0017g00505871 [Helianthus debilis subsp. tardiflorus]